MRRTSDWRRFAVAAILSLAAHIFFIIPRIISRLVMRPGDEELEVSWLPEAGEADQETAVAEAPPPPEPTPKPPEKEKRPPAPAPVPLKEEERKEAEKRPAELELKPAPPPPPPIDHRQQMVDQEQFPDEADNANAHFLAQKNHRAEKETRAKETNLVREMQGAAVSPTERSNQEKPDPGMKDDKLAELQNRDGRKNEVVRAAPKAGQAGETQREEAPKPGPLSMRDLTPKSAVTAAPEVKEREGLERQEEGAGELPMARLGQEGRREVAPSAGQPKVNLNLSHRLYDQIIGVENAEAERRAAAKAEQSHASGRWDRLQAKIAAMRSSIENFTPAVRPGNQSELGTRASPFAAYITAMHRQIHKLFSLGFLADIDARRDSAYASQELWTQLEIVVKPDGSVERVGIVRTSGLLAFDVAAIDSVMSAAPFPAPPEAIKSINGKVYLDWQFHRDDRACGTFGVDPHILTSVDEHYAHDTSETGAQAKALEKAARAESSGAAPRRGSGSHSEEEPTSPATSTPQATPESAEVAREAAEGWFDAYARGDTSWLSGWSAIPFRASGHVVARDAGHLKTMYQALLAEAPTGRAIDRVELLTPAAIRARLGNLPPGGEPSAMLFAIGRSGREQFVLLLKKSPAGWRVCGLAR